MRLTAILPAILLAALMAPQANAQSLNCGGEYVVKRGDTLQRITNRAYGRGQPWALLYEPNRGVIGANPSLIEVGMTLRIPCRDGAGPAAAAPRADAPEPETATVAPAAAPATATAAAAPMARRPGRAGQLRFVTATDWAPFSNQDEESGGMITEIVSTAMSRVVGPEDYKIDFVNDWAAHLDPLIADIAYDFSFPWFRPNCAVKEKLGAGSQFRCERLDWSDPLFEQVIGYYMRADDPAKPDSHEGLFGRTLCRPAGYSLFMMEEKDLTAPRITLVTPPSPQDCFEMLAAGEVDAVVIASMVADDAIARLEMGAAIEEQPQLASIATLHAVTSIDNPDKAAQLALINEGIREMRDSGKWFEIVQRHLIAHARLTATQ